MPPSTVVNGTQTFAPPGIALDDLLAKPFHIYDAEFYSVIGENPTLTLIAEQASNPLYHEAVVWFVHFTHLFPSQGSWTLNIS